MGHNGFDMFEPTIRCDNNSTSKCSYFGGLLAGYLCAGQLGGNNLGEIAIV